MDLALRPEDVELSASLAALLAEESSPTRIRAAEKLGFDAALWRSLTSFGIPALAGSEAAADVRQLALFAEQGGRHLASAPIVETLVTTRLLARCPEGADLLARAESGAVTTLVLHTTTADKVALVPAGAIADAVIRHDGSTLSAVASPAPMLSSPNLGSLPLADRDLQSSDVVPLASGDRARQVFQLAQQEWQLLTAAQLVGIAGRSLEIGVDYVKGRVIFDRPVGTFQTVAHRLADHATAIDGARLLVQEAAWAHDVSHPRAAELSKMAFVFAAEQALAVAGDALHYHGGYGFSLEYDIQLYYRRARALSLVWGSVQQEYQALATQLYGETVAS